MRTLRLKAVTLLGAAVLALAACGGGGAPGADPVGTVTAGFNAAESGGLTAMVPFVCAAQRDNIAKMFGAGGMEQLTAAGVDPNELFGAMKFDFTDLKATESSRSGDKAVVHVTGKVAFTFDQAKFREIMKKVLETQGMPVDDATIDQMITAMGGSLSQTQDIDEDVNVVNEGGKWLMCE